MTRRAHVVAGIRPTGGHRDHVVDGRVGDRQITAAEPTAPPVAIQDLPSGVAVPLGDFQALRSPPLWAPQDGFRVPAVMPVTRVVCGVATGCQFASRDAIGDGRVKASAHGAVALLAHAVSVAAPHRERDDGKVLLATSAAFQGRPARDAEA